MPVIFTIKDKEYSYPEGWQDVTLSRWLESLDALAHKPKELTELEAAQTTEEVRKIHQEKIVPNYGVIAQFYVDYMHFWTGISKELLMKTEGSTVKIDGEKLKGWQWIENLYIQIRNNFMRSEKKASEDQSSTIEHNGQIWYLPKEHLQGETLNVFIESQQAKHLAKHLQGNHAKALPKLIAVFLKSKPGAVYNPQQLQREKLFLSMTMDKAFRVSFFLSKLNEKLLQNFLIYTAVLALSQLQHKDAQA